MGDTEPVLGLPGPRRVSEPIPERLRSRAKPKGSGGGSPHKVRKSDELYVKLTRPDSPPSKVYGSKPMPFTGQTRRKYGSG